MSEEFRTKITTNKLPATEKTIIHDERDYDYVIGRITELEGIIAEEEKKIRDYFARQQPHKIIDLANNSTLSVN